jgi:acetamidase/formamidase
MLIVDGRKESNLHTAWSPENAEIFAVPQNEIVQIIIPDSSTMQITKDSTSDMLRQLDSSKYDAAVGPIRVEGATSGDSIDIEIIQIKTADWGWTSISPNFGLIKNRFTERLFHWRIFGGYAIPMNDFLHGVRIRTNPFLGVIGTQPSSGKYGMIPPRHFGGNMDNRLLTSGSRLYLPCNVDGGMVSFGDPHAAQGDGEVCGTAIETSAEAIVRFRVLKGERIAYPRARIPPIAEPESIMTSGISRSLKQAAIIAVEEMIDDLGRMHHLSAEEAYVLCSVAGNLKVSEIVDEPNFVVSLTLPRNIFNQD